MIGERKVNSYRLRKVELAAAISLVLLALYELDKMRCFCPFNELLLINKKYKSINSCQYMYVLGSRLVDSGFDYRKWVVFEQS